MAVKKAKPAAKKPLVKQAKPDKKKAEKKPEKKKEAPKKAAKPAVKKVLPEPKEATRTYHVVKRKEDGKWEVKFAGGQKAIKLFDTQKEAIEYSKVMAKNQGGSMLVHNSKGQNKGRIKKK